MLYSLAAILIALWLVGTVLSYTLSGLLHVLLAVAIVLIVVRMVRGRRAA